MPQAQTGRQRFYHDVQLRGPIPSRFLHTPTPLRHPPDAMIEAVSTLAQSPSTLADGLTPYGLFDSFTWLPALARAEAGERLAQGMMALWLERSGRYRPKPWAPPVVAERVHHLLSHLRMMVVGRDAPWREAVFDSLARQGRHLRRVEQRAGADETALRVAMARALIALCFPDDRTTGPPESSALNRGLEAIAAGQVPPSWSNPERALRFAAEMATLRDAYRARALTPPQSLAEAQKVVHLFVGGWIEGTGRIVPLPLGQAGDPTLLATLDPPRRHASGLLLEAVGVYRLEAEETTLWVDGRDKGGAAGAMTLYANGRPIIVNCGAPSSLSAALIPKLATWREALKGPAAASTLDADISGAPVAEWTEGSPGQGLQVGRRDGSRWHSRQISLSSDGRAVAGTDQTDGNAGEETYRFHLAPETTIAREAPGVFLLKALGEQAPPWRLAIETETAHSQDVESVFAGIDGQVEPSRQIVIRSPDGILEWSITQDG